MRTYYRYPAFIKAIQCVEHNIRELESLGYEVTGNLNPRGWVYLGKKRYAEPNDYIVWEGNLAQPIIMNEERFHAVYVATFTCEGCGETQAVGEPCSCAFGDCTCWKCEQERK